MWVPVGVLLAAALSRALVAAPGFCRRAVLVRVSVPSWTFSSRKRSSPPNGGLLVVLWSDGSCWGDEDRELLVDPDVWDLPVCELLDHMLGRALVGGDDGDRPAAG